MRRKKFRGLFAAGSLILLTVFLNLYMNKDQQRVDFPGILYNIPTYKNSRLSPLMSSQNSDPYIMVFLTDDSYEKVLQFYKEKLKREPKVLHYGLRAHTSMTVYQFELEKGILKDYINKGVEIIALRDKLQRVYKARTKIRIIIPKKEVVELTPKKDERMKPKTQR